MIDAHSHIGKDSFHHIEGQIEEYVKAASKIGIKTANLMPTPCPVYISDKGIIHPLIWTFNGSSISFHKKTIRNDTVTLVQNPINPYKKYNEFIEEKIKEARGIEINFIPLIHPILDKYEHIENLLSKRPKALKIHGVAAGISPLEIPAEFWKMLQAQDIPIIVHTDYWSTPEKSGLPYLYQQNSALNWITTLERYELHGFITHGARLCPSSIEKIRKSNKFLVGISPDLLISSEPKRLSVNAPYLETLISGVEPSKLSLDIDYPWNINYRFSEGEIPTQPPVLDWGIIDRIKKYASKEELTRITTLNSQSFFDIK